MAAVQNTCLRVGNLGKRVTPAAFTAFIETSGLKVGPHIRYTRCAPHGVFGFVDCHTHEDAVRLLAYLCTAVPPFGTRKGTKLDVDWARSSHAPPSTPSTIFVFDSTTLGSVSASSSSSSASSSSSTAHTKRQRDSFNELEEGEVPPPKKSRWDVKPPQEAPLPPPPAPIIAPPPDVVSIPLEEYIEYRIFCANRDKDNKLNAQASRAPSTPPAPQLPPPPSPIATLPPPPPPPPLPPRPRALLKPREVAKKERRAGGLRTKEEAPWRPSDKSLRVWREMREQRERREREARRASPPPRTPHKVDSVVTVPPSSKDVDLSLLKPYEEMDGALVVYADELEPHA